MKVKEYRNFAEFNGDPYHHGDECVAIVNNPNGTVCADVITSCKRWQTAVRRFFKALAGDSRFDGWQEAITECCDSGYFSDKETCWDPKTGTSKYYDGYFWEVEDLDGSFYVCLNVVC